jgi:transcriptional regulator with XRE-family HTH domain
MKTSELPTQEELLREALQDPEFRAEWDRTALARAVATWVAKYRTERKLSQTRLAAILGWRQPNVARLESGEHEPSLATLRAPSRRFTPPWGASPPRPTGDGSLPHFGSLDRPVEDLLEDGQRTLAALGAELATRGARLDGQRQRLADDVHRHPSQHQQARTRRPRPLPVPPAPPQAPLGRLRPGPRHHHRPARSDL